MTRVLVSLWPLMYREVVALAVHRHRPGLDVRLAPPGAAERELEGFRPHLLVHDDYPISAEALDGATCRVEAPYSAPTGAKTIVDGAVEETGDMGTAGLLRAVDRAAALASRPRASLGTPAGPFPDSSTR